MNIGGFDINFPFWTRSASGENFYDIKSASEWSKESSNLNMAQNHPILTPALLFVAKLYSQANITIVNKKTGKEVHNHPMHRVLAKPNFYQTMPDLLETLSFMQLANGVGVLYAKKTFGTDEVNALYPVDYTLIDFPDEVKKGYMKNSEASDKLLNKKVIYDASGENLEIRLRDLMFFYDSANGMNVKNPFKAISRLDGLKQTLINTNDSLIAKNIILRTNGKEMLSGSKEGFPLDPQEKQEAENLFNSQYGLSPSRKRGLITKANVTWKSLHIALRDLGLDESVKVDGNIIFTALHIPKDILSLEAKKTILCVPISCSYLNANGRYQEPQIPGGTVEAGELPAVAALREAHEETGLTALKLVKYLGCFERNLAEIGRDETIMAWFFHLHTDDAGAIACICV